MRMSLRRTPGLQAPKELRIDVQLSPDAVEAELDRLHGRLESPGDAMYGLPSMLTPWPELVFRYRQADGEHYVYVQDVARGRLAGCTVFNRLVELDRRADRHLRAPHSRYAPAYQRRGIATAVYEWGLASGLCLISGPRQSAGAHALWLALARRHALLRVELHERRLGLLRDAAPLAANDLRTRLVLLGEGWSLSRFLAETGCRGGCG